MGVGFAPASGLLSATRRRPEIIGVSPRGVEFAQSANSGAQRAKRFEPTAHERIRKPYGLKADKARQIIEFDMIHIQLLGVKLYAFCGRDQFSREAVVHIATSPSSKNAKTAIKKIIARFGSDIKIINDNSSENMKDVETFLAQMNITQYWTRPHTPKDKAFNERFY
ncbi:MAG: transposase family protein [Spirochaetaceae bacterium]|jgi:hypothetical protein|nr:transposase family protein [Spirochaetaceae bacterium]